MINPYRQVEPNDNLALAQMIRQVFIEHDAPKEGTVYSDPTTDDLFSLFRQANSALWVLELDDKVMGCCGIYPTAGLPEGCVELVKFYLSSDARGSGWGRGLMENCMNSARYFGYKQVYIETLPIFDKAIKMYEKEGFVRLNKALGNSGHTTCNVWMLKDL